RIPGGTPLRAESLSAGVFYGGLSALLICSASSWSLALGIEPPSDPLDSDREEGPLDSFPPKIVWTSPAHETLAVYPNVPMSFSSMNP
ncbi:MAG: hypothetical protein ACE5QF_06605, partial [Thermoplasmata archaeon]